MSEGVVTDDLKLFLETNVPKVVVCGALNGFLILVVLFGIVLVLMQPLSIILGTYHYIESPKLGTCILFIEHITVV